MNASQTWKAYKQDTIVGEEGEGGEGGGIVLDISLMGPGHNDLEPLTPALENALEEMDALERGAIANADENRMVGHYWLRAPRLAPTNLIRHDIEHTLSRIETFARKIHDGEISPERAERFRHVILVGIGGSALGPQLIHSALGTPTAPLTLHFVDNTDPDGIDNLVEELGEALAETLIVVISKSGTTPETRNGMAELASIYDQRGLVMAEHAVAITGVDSELERLAKSRAWLDILPMWDWIGGRTSITSAVGLLPAALIGVDIRRFLEGARSMDSCTRRKDIRRNPALMMAAMWHKAVSRDHTAILVILPYKDRLSLMARYLQQLIMESLGKKYNRAGEIVHHGLTVYGNKGSTDQHAYVQQLRDGGHDYFATFIEVLKDREGPSEEVSDAATSGDYLLGFLLGTRQALMESGHYSMTITLPDVSARSLGALIALYERTVGFYASLVNINAYHQPGVEAGKKAAGSVLALQRRAMRFLEDGGEGDVEAIASALGVGEEEMILLHKLLEHLAANSRISKNPGADRFSHVYRAGQTSEG